MIDILYEASSLLNNNKGEAVDMSKDAYSRISRWYDMLFDSMNAGLRAVSHKMLPPQDDMRVLDVGCGTGSNLEAYQKAGCSVYGIDMSPSMLQIAEQKLQEDAELYLGNATAMPYEDNFFDLVTTTLMLHEVSPSVRDQVITEMQRTVKPDGSIILIDFHPGKLRFPRGWMYKIIITISEIAAGREHFANYRQFMASNGLPSIIDAHQLAIEKKKVVSGGNMALFLLSVETEKPAI
jgi:ubiquinone/menaquinone biosynthesis C-methylase UbiE